MSFKLEERVLCFHGPLLYEAKVLKSKTNVNTLTEEDKKQSRSSSKELLFLVHYKGWKRTWDEWVLEDRLRKWSEENLKLSKELKLDALAAQKRASEAATQKRLTSANSTNGKEAPSNVEKSDVSTAQSSTLRGNKRLRDAEADKEDSLKPEFVLDVPDILKARLVDDWEWVTKDQRLAPLPRQPSVSQILIDYRMSVPMKRPGSAEAEIFEETLLGLQTYFDKCLGTILLYRFERQQYADIRKKHGEDAKMSDIYGAEHLLRLFGLTQEYVQRLVVLICAVSMQELVGLTQMDPQAVDVLRSHLQDLMRYMSVNLEDLFVEEYDVTQASYTRLLNYQ